MSVFAHNAIAAFIESAIGPAIPTDASGVYFNPAALTLLPSKQAVVAEAYVPIHFNFQGTTIQNLTQMRQTGVTQSDTIYHLPSAFLSIPLNKQFILGLGGLYNAFGIQNFPNDSIARYISTYTSISSVDLIPSLTYRVNDNLSIGAGLDFEELNIHLNSIVGFPDLGIPDASLNNTAKNKGAGGHIGFLIQPRLGTAIGLVYHSQVRFHPKGSSVFQSATPFISNNFHFNLSLPPSTVLSIDQFVNSSLGFIGTLQYTQWSVINSLNLQNIALIRNGQNLIVPLSLNHFKLQDTWRAQLGVHYSANKQLILRAAAAYDQEPNNAAFQIGLNNNVLLSANATYWFNKKLGVELGYSHAFYITQNINITSTANTAIGTVDGYRDGFLAKIIWNIN